MFFPLQITVTNLGHEVVGYVEDLGPKVLNLRKGDLVAWIDLWCGHEVCDRARRHAD